MRIKFIVLKEGGCPGPSDKIIKEYIRSMTAYPGLGMMVTLEGNCYEVEDVYIYPDPSPEDPEDFDAEVYVR